MSEQVRILLADDDPQMQLAISSALSGGVYEVKTANNGKSALELLGQQEFDLLITDQRMPEMTGLELLEHLKSQGSVMPCIMITAHGTITQAVEAIQAGAADFIPKPFDADELERVIERVLSPANKEFREQRQTKNTDKASARPIVSNDKMMIRILEVAEAVAKSDATVLIQGESGTGKELIARLIHSSSARVGQPFVAVNCAALPATLLESELFGHEKGAFTGAHTRKIGRFEMAHGGTILLDEISEMDLNLQAKLLRVLQEREVDRVGGKEPINIDVRVLATTNRNLEQSVEKGDFRADLYYRLNVIPLTLPPLRERKGDVRLLVQHFLQKYLGNQAPVIGSELFDKLEGYSWPGNIRELQNAVERAAILSRGRDPKEADFLIGKRSAPSLAEQVIREVDQETTEVIETDESLVIKSGMTVHEVEKQLILETLRSTNENRTQAAKLLGISIRTLRNKLNEYKEQASE